MFSGKFVYFIFPEFLVITQYFDAQSAQTKFQEERFHNYQLATGLHQNKDM